MNELKAKIKTLANDRKIYQAKLEDLYTAVTGDKEAFFTIDHTEVINMALMANESFTLMQYATSDEYIEIYNRMLEDQS
jgi:hypothetical protein